MKKNILIIVPTLLQGGMEHIACETAKLLSDDYNVKLVIFDGSNAVYHPSCCVENLNVPASNNTLSRAINQIKRAFRLWKIKKSFKSDYSISFGPTASLTNVLAFGCGKCIVCVRGFAEVKAYSKMKEFVFNKADAIIGNSKRMTTKIKELYPDISDKVFCVYNPIDYNQIIEKGNIPVDDYSFDGKIIASCGRLEKVKNYPRLIRAFSILEKYIPDAKLLIIGDGSQREVLQKLINDLGIAQKVTLLGFRSNPHAYLSKSHIYVLSSRNEGFPNALIEGMLFMPVVATNCESGPSEILCDKETESCSSWIESSYGILSCNVNDYSDDAQTVSGDKDLAEAIMCLLTDNGKYDYFLHQAKDRIADFSNANYVSSLKSILRGLKNGENSNGKNG